jgi:hypothetical protein
MRKAPFTLPLLVRALAVLGLGWVIEWPGIDHAFDWLRHLVELRAIPNVHTAHFDAALFDALGDSQFVLQHLTFLPLLFTATLLVPLAALVRTVARARLRAGLADPLERVRRWLAGHPRGGRVLVAVPAALWLANWTRHVALYVVGWRGSTMYGASGRSWWPLSMHEYYACGMVAAWCLAALAAVGIHALTRAGLRALVAPTPVPDVAAAGDRIVFDAVAVTPETRAAVVAMAALPFVSVGAIVAASLGDAATIAALCAYVAVAVSGTIAFRRASRVAIGIDGVFISGTSRTRFSAYRDLDDARAVGGDLELLRAGRGIVRLQLHGEDAVHRTAILERLRASIDAVRQGEAANGAGNVVATTSDGELARIAEGAVDYRAPALTREQLWSVVEGSAHAAPARIAAAKALATLRDPGESARLRVVADHCAEPGVRVELRELVYQTEEEEEGVASTRKTPFIPRG